MVHRWPHSPDSQVIPNRRHACVAVHHRRPGLQRTVGGGILYSLNARVSLRGDVRYMHALVEEDKQEGGFFKDYGFWRAAVGVTLHSAISEWTVPVVPHTSASRERVPADLR
jgi:hypothetical protein